MIYKNLVKLCVFIVVFSLVLSSCKKDRKSGWDTELLVPIANSSLSLQNLVKDSSIVTNSDNSLTLSYSSTLYGFNLADQIINIPDTAIGQKFGLNSLALPNQSVNFTTSLGMLANNMVISPDPTTQFLGQFILANNGQSVAIPAVNGISPAPFHFDATSFFDSAILSSGVVKLWVVNHLPIPITGATVSLYNTADHSLVASRVLPSVNAFDSVYVELPISGTRITNQLDFVITDLSTPGSNNVPVPIDTNDYIQLKMFVTELRANEAWAKFPPQNVVDLTEEVTQEIGDRQLTYIDARSGFLHIFITSSVEEQLYLEYTLVGAYDNYGHPLKVYTTVPPAPVGGTSTIDDSIDIAGYAINLTGKDGSKFNTYTQRVVAHIDSSGITRHITVNDSLNVRYEISRIAPNYVKGYAGRDTIHAIDSTAFAFLDIFKSGSIDLEDVNMNFTVENNIGIDGQIKINSLTAVSKNNGSRTLTGSILGQPLQVHRATDFPLTPAVDNYAVNSTNSNIKDLLGILPNQLLYDVEVKTNTNGNTRQYRDFAYLESSLNVKLNAEIPLSLIANNLLLQDTLAFDLSQTNTNVDGITDGIINVIIQNKYPITSNITMVVYDENWIAIDTLLSNQLIDAANLNNDCRVTESKRTKIPLYVDEARMDNLKLGKHAVITAAFSTAANNQLCNGQHIKIYSDYKLDVTLSARFNYAIKTGF